jgi:hypothetical protein
LDEAVSRGKKVKLKKANKKKPPQVVKAEPIKKEVAVVDENLSNENSKNSSLELEKITKQKDSEIIDNFLNNVLLPMMKDAYVNLENLEKNKYKQREALV